MKVINIIDSLELNGGSTTFLEMAAGMHKYWKGDIRSYVVSKTGLFGRKGLVDNGFAPSYKVPLEVYNYSSFEKKIVPEIRDCLVFHHVLGYTKSIKFHKSCRYVVINHRDVNLHRLPGFKAFKIVCVSDYFAKQVRKAKAGNPVVILNGCGDYYNTEPSHVSDKLVLGRCQRVTPAKFLNEKIRDKRVSQYIIGPVDPKAKRLIPKGAKLFGPVFRLNKKIPIIKSFDLYLHGSPRPEGCSMAILEALSCVPEEQEIFIGNRLKTMKDVKVNDEVYGGIVQKVFNNGIKKRVKEIKVMGHPSFRVTPDHRVLTVKVERLKNSFGKYKKVIKAEKWSCADNLLVNDYVVFPKFKYEVDKPFIIDFSPFINKQGLGKKYLKNLLHTRYLNKEFSYLLGWYLAEGSSKSNGVVCFDLSHKEMNYAEEIKFICERCLGVKVRIVKTLTTLRIYFCSTDISKWFKSFLGDKSLTKRIPGFILNAKKDILESFLLGYIRGDGWVYKKKNKIVLSTVSKELSYQLILAYSKLDLFAVRTCKNRKKKKQTLCGRLVNANPSWNITVTIKSVNSKKRHIEDDRNFYILITCIRDVYGEFKVMNFTSDTSKYCVPFITTHNCGIPIIARDRGGGVNEIIEQGVNGFLYKNDAELKRIISRFIDDKDYMEQMKKSTHKNFMERFHVKHMLDNYKRIFDDC